MAEDDPGSPGPPPAVRDLCAVLEVLELLWDREARPGSSTVVSPSQLRVLYALERASVLNLRELGEAVGSAPSAMSRLCARLEAMGFVKRLPSAQSGREIELHLTPHATAHLAELRSRREETLDAVLASLSPAALRSLAEGVAALRTTLDARMQFPPGEQIARSA